MIAKLVKTSRESVRKTIHYARAGVRHIKYKEARVVTYSLARDRRERQGCKPEKESYDLRRIVKGLILTQRCSQLF